MNRLLQPLFGRSPQPSQLALVLLSAAAVALIAFVDGTIYGYAPAHRLLLTLLALDIGGGVAANVTRSTNDWYVAQRPSVTILFLALHALHPLLFMRFLGLAPTAALALYGIAAGGAALVIVSRKRTQQKVLAFALTAVAISLYNTVFLPPPPILPLASLYLVKLILAFAPDHYAAG